MVPHVIFMTGSFWGRGVECGNVVFFQWNLSNIIRYRNIFCAMPYPIGCVGIVGKPTSGSFSSRR